MIPRLICFIFGHKRREKAYTGEYTDLEGKRDPFGRPTAMYVWQYLKECPRCGASLKGESR